jgi:hypothetical protein
VPELQQSLFAGYPMTNAAVTTATNPRQAVIDATTDKADAEWKGRYRAFALDYLAIHADGTAEEIRLAYNERPGLPKTDKQQSSGGIFQRLVKSGQIEPCGMRRSTIYGNMLQVYRLKRS